MYRKIKKMGLDMPRQKQDPVITNVITILGRNNVSASPLTEKFSHSLVVPDWLNKFYELLQLLEQARILNQSSYDLLSIINRGAVDTKCLYTFPTLKILSKADILTRPNFDAVMKFNPDDIDALNQNLTHLTKLDQANFDLIIRSPADSLYSHVAILNIIKKSKGLSPFRDEILGFQGEVGSLNFALMLANLDDAGILKRQNIDDIKCTPEIFKDTPCSYVVKLRESGALTQENFDNTMRNVRTMRPGQSDELSQKVLWLCMDLQKGGGLFNFFKPSAPATAIEALKQIYKKCGGGSMRSKKFLEIIRHCILPMTG